MGITGGGREGSRETEQWCTQARPVEEEYWLNRKWKANPTPKKMDGHSKEKMGGVLMRIENGLNYCSPDII